MCNGRKRSICSCRRMQWVNVLSHNCWVIDHWGVKKKCIECVAVWNEMNWRGQVQRCTENQKKRTTTTDAVKWKEQTTMLVCVKWIKLNTPEKRKAEETLKWSCCEGIFNYKSNSNQSNFVSFPSSSLSPAYPQNKNIRLQSKSSCSAIEWWLWVSRSFPPSNGYIFYFPAGPNTEGLLSLQLALLLASLLGFPLNPSISS